MEVAAAVTAVAVVTKTKTALKLKPTSISIEMLVCSVVVSFSPVSCVTVLLSIALPSRHFRAVKTASLMQ